jgi:hypothetical protein
MTSPRFTGSHDALSRRVHTIENASATSVVAPDTSRLAGRWMGHEPSPRGLASDLARLPRDRDGSAPAPRSAMKIALTGLAHVRGGATLGSVAGGGSVGSLIDRTLPIPLIAGPRRPPQGDGIPLPAHVWGAPNR